MSNSFSTWTTTGFYSLLQLACRFWPYWELNTSLVNADTLSWGSNNKENHMLRLSSVSFLQIWSRKLFIPEGTFSYCIIAVTEWVEAGLSLELVLDLLFFIEWSVSLPCRCFQPHSTALSINAGIIISKVKTAVLWLLSPTSICMPVMCMVNMFG